MARYPTRRLPPSEEDAAGGRTPTFQIAMAQLSRNVQDRRTAKNWSQSDLARKIWGERLDKRTGHMVAKNRDTISRIEMGNRLPHPRTLRQLANALGCTLVELAPGLTAAAIKREDLALSMTVASGHPDMVFVRVSKLLPVDAANQIWQIASQAKVAHG